jgi:hypothetical protein
MQWLIRSWIIKVKNYFDIATKYELNTNIRNYKMDLYDKTEQFVVDAFTKVEKLTDISHGKRTVYWIKWLKSDADEALLIAGVAHDIERAIYGDWKKGSSDLEDLKKHQNLSADEIEKFLKSENANQEIIDRVKNLIAHHEEGGDEDQNVLCDADCLSFFEEKILRRVKKYKEDGKSKEEIKKNVDYYFSRIISEKAKQIATKWYEEALREMEI